MENYKIIIPTHLEDDIEEKDLDVAFIEQLIGTLKARRIRSAQFDLEMTVKEKDIILTIKF